MNQDSLGARLAAIERRIQTTAEVVRPLLAEEGRAHTREATAASVARADHWAARATALRAENDTVAQVALKLSAERGEPTSERDVYRWLKRQRENP